MPTTLMPSEELANLSLFAAYEIDLKLGGLDPARPTVLRELGEHLTKVSGSDAGLSTAFMRADPMTTEVLSRAIEEANATAITNIEGLATEIKNVIGPLTDEASEPSSEQLLRVKSFCLALHRSMMANSMPPLQEWGPNNREMHLA